MSGQVRVVLEQGDLKVTRDPSDVDDKKQCEHKLSHRDGFANPGLVRDAIRGVTGVSHAYTSRSRGTVVIYYGLVDDDPVQYRPVAERVIAAVQAIL